MTPPPIRLAPLELDALTELVNIGVSRAAASLRKMVGEEVFLSVPSVEVITRRSAETLLRERETGVLVAVRQTFTGAFSGRAMLIFPESNSLDLVRAVAGPGLAPEEVLELEHEALAETGNVVLNSCLATMANLLQRPLELSLPEVIRSEHGELFEVGHSPSGEGEGVVLFLYINFAIRQRNIRGYIALLMDLPSLEILKSLIGEFIERVAGQQSEGAG